MSAAVPDEFINDLNERDFPYLSGKVCMKRSERGRRHGAEEEMKMLHGGRATIMKNIADPAGLLGKRRQARLLSESSDNFQPNVEYSMNRKNRWELDVPTLLDETANSEVEVKVVERVLNNGRGYNVRDVVAVHSLDADGEIVTKKAGGKGATLKNITTPEGPKRRGGKARKEAAAREAEQAEEKSEIEEPQPSIQYCIRKAPDNMKLLCGRERKRACNYTGLGSKSRSNAKTVDMRDYETSDMERSFNQEDTDVYKPSRDMKFCLGDYIVDKPTAAVFVRRQSIESVKNPEELEKQEQSDAAKPFDLLDVSEVQRIYHMMKSAYIKTTKWNNFNFNDQVDVLMAEGDLITQWLDLNNKRVSIDASAKVRRSNEDSEHKPYLFIFLEKSRRKNNIRVSLSTLIHPQCWRPDIDLLKTAIQDSGNLTEIVQNVIKLVQQWRNNPISLDVDLPTARFIEKQIAYHPSVTPNHMTRSAMVIEESKMSAILRDVSIVEEDGEAFERLSDDEFSSCEEFTMVGAAAPKVRCISCLTTDEDELFELDDSWQCRECLRKHIVSLIRTRNIPIQIPFVMPAGSSTYDVLPAIISLPLLSFYTKIASRAVMEISGKDIGDLVECPGCRKTTLSERANEWHICNCSGCGVRFCVDCGCEPHWPMSCEMFQQWTEKWEKHYASETMAGDGSQCILRMDCECQWGVIMAGEKSEYARCPSCRIEICPLDMTVINRHFLEVDPRTRKAYKSAGMMGRGKEFAPGTLNRIPLTKLIKKEYAEICTAARKLRFDESKTAEFEKYARKLKEGKEDAGRFAEKIIDMRRTVLYLVENVLGWLYMERNQPNMGGFKTSIIQLFKLYENLASEIDEPRFLESKIDALQQAINKTFESIKTHLNTTA